MAECIDRQVAIEQIKAEWAKLPLSETTGFGILMRVLTSIPAADVRPRWIPVTERLPKEGEFVLVHGNLYPNKHDGGVIAVSKRMDWNYWQGFGRERDITHWMPLPQPPKEEG